jgi:fatty-acyl-CoA synthase
MGPALARCARAWPRPVVIDVCDSEYTGAGERLGTHEYEALLAAHDAAGALEGPADEWDAIAVSYTSGTTGDPKGVVTHHRGAYLNAVCNAATWTMPHFPVYLWTLPMFHCNGWCFPWTVAMLGGTHVCLRRVEAGPSWRRCASTAWTTTAPRPSCTA